MNEDSTLSTTQLWKNSPGWTCEEISSTKLKKKKSYCWTDNDFQQNTEASFLPPATIKKKSHTAFTLVKIFI